MTTRTSFELHPDLCRLVEVQSLAGDRRSADGDARVRQFVTRLKIDPQSPDFSESLRHLREDPGLAPEAVVTLWGLRSTHQFLRLPPTEDAELEAVAVQEAKEEIALLEGDGSRASVAVVVGADVSIGTQRRREVSLTAASSSEIERRIQPIAAAGFDVVRVVTPAMALTSLARSRRDTQPGAATMYVGLADRATCVAIVRDGVLLVARELPWGHVVVDAADEPFERRLASELRRSLLFFRQMFRATPDVVVMCGDVAKVRALAAVLSGALGLPVQTLDSLTGIDAASVPEPADVFRADVAALRLAIAVGAEAAPQANLRPSPGRSTRTSRRLRRYLVAAAAAAVILPAIWYGLARRTPTPMTPTAVARSTNDRATPAVDAQRRTPPVMPPVEPPPPAPPRAVPRDSEPAAKPVVVDRSNQQTRPPIRSETGRGRVGPIANAPAVAAEPEREIMLASILYSPDRQLALVDGRVAGVGDRVGTSLIVAILPRAIVLESPTGERRTVELHGLTRKNAVR
jgi:hypothetical protein